MYMLCIILLVGPRPPIGTTSGPDRTGKVSGADPGNDIGRKSRQSLLL